MTQPLSSNSPTERIGFVEKERSFRRDECVACNCRNDLIAFAAIAASEGAANDAFLNPCFIRRELSVRGQTGDFCTRAGPAWRTVVCFAGAKHEIARMRSGPLRRTEEFHMVHFGKAVALTACRIRHAKSVSCS